MPYFIVDGEKLIADNTEVVKCPCCNAELLVGFSEWFNFVAEKAKVKEVDE